MDFAHGGALDDLDLLNQPKVMAFCADQDFNGGILEAQNTAHRGDAPLCLAGFEDFPGGPVVDPDLELAGRGFGFIGQRDVAPLDVADLRFAGAVPGLCPEPPQLL